MFLSFKIFTTCLFLPYFSGLFFVRCKMFQTLHQERECYLQRFFNSGLNCLFFYYSAFSRACNRRLFGCINNSLQVYRYILPLQYKIVTLVVWLAGTQYHLP